MVQELNSGEHLFFLVSMRKFDHSIIPFEPDYLTGLKLISEDFQKSRIISAVRLNHPAIPYQKP